MTLDNINNTLTFLQRINLQGSEAQVFVECVNALQMEGQQLALAQQQKQQKPE